MDIGSKSKYPAGALSNFSPYPFVFDGIECNSMEGLLQAFKFDKIHVQLEVVKLVGIKAKYKGKKRNKHWKQRQTLYWRGISIDRHSVEYQQLLDYAYYCLALNTKYQKALLATNNSVLTHSIGCSKPQDTVLTEREFCRRLTNIREILKCGEIILPVVPDFMKKKTLEI